MAHPNSSPTPYGNRTRAVVPVGIKEIAINANGWATAHQLLGWLASPAGNYVECNFVYAKNIPGLTEGWYFWRGYLSSTTGVIWQAYVTLTFDPVGDDATITLHNSNGTWFASYQDHTRGILNSYQIQQAPNTTLHLSPTPRHRIGFETSSSNCAHYSSFVSMQLTKYKYLDQAGNETTQNPTAVGDENNLATCIGMDRALLKIFHL